MKVMTELRGHDYSTEEELRKRLEELDVQEKVNRDPIR